MDQTKAGLAGTEQNQQYNPCKQMLLLCTSFFLIFSAYLCLETLQSSINSRNGLGLYSLVALYATASILTVVSVPVIVRKLTLKWSLIMGWFAHILYALSNIYPTWRTMIPAAVLLGFATGFVWTCNGVYITTFANRKSDLSGTSKVVTMTKYMGYHGMAIAVTGIGGTLFSSAVFTYFAPRRNDTMFSHVSQQQNNETYQELNLCGDSFDMAANRSIQKQTSEDVQPLARYILIGGFVLMQLIAIILSCFLVNPKSEKHLEESSKQTFLNTLKLLTNYQFLTIATVQSLNATATAVFQGKYLKDFVACTSGVHVVSYVLFAFGVTRLISSYLIGHLNKKIHRKWHVLVAFCCCGAYLVLTITWNPASGHVSILFIPAVLIAVVKTVVSVHTQALTGILFSHMKKEAFACLMTLRYIASAFLFFLNIVLSYKLLIIIASCHLVLAIISSVILEFTIWKKEKATLKKNMTTDEKVESKELMEHKRP